MRPFLICELMVLMNWRSSVVIWKSRSLQLKFRESAYTFGTWKRWWFACVRCGIGLYFRLTFTFGIGSGYLHFSLAGSFFCYSAGLASSSFVCSSWVVTSLTWVVSVLTPISFGLTSLGLFPDAVDLSFTVSALLFWSAAESPAFSFWVSCILSYCVVLLVGTAR